MTNYIERYWRDATPEDAIKQPPMVARFRDINYSWQINTLRGIRQGAEFPWFSESKGSFQHCQVYDAPDPGEGWRLVDTNSEGPEEGDEFYLPYINEWAYCNEFLSGVRYTGNQAVRRRIEQPKPEPKYVPFEWADREQLRGRWIVRSKNDETREEVAYRFDSRDFDVLAKHLLEDDWRFLDTGEPVGKKVE